MTLGKILQRNGRDYDRRSDAEGNAPIITALYGPATARGTSARCSATARAPSTPSVVRHGGEIRQQVGVDHPDFFDQIDSPEQAYWLGFLSADGCMISTERHPEGDHLSVRLAARDKGHLVKLKEALGAHASVLDGVSNGFGKPAPSANLNVGSRSAHRRSHRSRDRPSQVGHPGTVGRPGRPHASLLARPVRRGRLDGHEGAGPLDGLPVRLGAVRPGLQGMGARDLRHQGEPYFKTGCWYVSISGRHQVAKIARAMYEDATVSLDRKQERADLILTTE